jgi:hypothetical protein
MNQDEKLKKMCNDFSSLDENQQDYILGILQALVFARTNPGTADKKTDLINAEKQKNRILR